MALNAAIAGLALVWCVTAHAASQGGTVREPFAQDLSGAQSSHELVLRALYSRAGAMLWAGDAAAEARRSAALRLMARETTLDPSVKVDLRQLASGFEARDAARLALADRSLTRAWLAYLSRRRGSADIGDTNLVSAAWAALGEGEALDDLALAALELAIVKAVGGWRPVSARLESWAEPVALEAVEIDREDVLPKRRLIVDPTELRRRLVQSMDLPAKYLQTEAPTSVLTQAIRRFQSRHGLPADGIVGARTLAALREPVAEQLARVELNLARNKQLASRAALRRYVEVNIPAFELRFVREGTVILRSRVIVGNDKTPTPVFEDVIRFIDLDPVWYVPSSIVKEVLERAQRESGYLERAGFVWQNGEGGRLRLVQRPGPENALGRFKFVFPNHHAVYLHDTAQRGLFGRADQALSHGCVRVERSAELALALLAEQGWDSARLGQALATRRTRRIELVEPVPVFLDYRTADLDPQGRLRLLADLYGHDRAARAAATSAKPVAWLPSRRQAESRRTADDRLASAAPATSFD